MSSLDPIPSEQRPVLEYASPGVGAKSQRPMSGVLRFAGIYAGVVVPVACFVMSATGFTLGPRHQSGSGADYARLLAEWGVSGTSESV